MAYQKKGLVILLLLPGLCLAKETFYDPMRPLIKMPIVAQVQKILKINMIFYVKPSGQETTKSWAIINGEKYSVGDIALGRKLVDISGGEVVFEYHGKQYKQGLVKSSYVKKLKNNNKSRDIFDGT